MPGRHHRNPHTSRDRGTTAHSALRFFFTVTLDRPDLSRRLVLACFPRKLPAVLSVEEVGRLLEAAPASVNAGRRAWSRSNSCTPSSCSRLAIA
jgi:site-specific recombinase XerD